MQLKIQQKNLAKSTYMQVVKHEGSKDTVPPKTQAHETKIETEFSPKNRP